MCDRSPRARSSHALRVSIAIATEAPRLLNPAHATLGAMRPDAQQWWNQAQADLRSARTLLQSSEFYATSFHAQQAAEKARKALLIEQHGATLPRRTHDLEFLAVDAGILADLRRELATRAPVFEMARYPDATGIAPVNRISQVDAERHLDAAERTVAWIAGRL